MAEKTSQTFWKFVVQHKKRDDVEETAFIKWYKHELMPECVQVLKNHNIHRFSVVYTPSAVRKPQQEEMAKLDHAKGVVPDWDVTTCYWLHHPEDLKKLHDDPEWTEKAAVPALKWIDPEVHVSFGQEVVYLDEGQLIQDFTTTN